MMRLWPFNIRIVRVGLTAMIFLRNSIWQVGWTVDKTPTK